MRIEDLLQQMSEDLRKIRLLLESKPIRKRKKK
jgi:hypothetical protein